MKKAPIVVLTRSAGEDHQVVTIVGGGGNCRQSPCPTCPWRQDAVGIFPAEAFRLSAGTAYDMAREEFACHQSGAAKPATCAGYLLNGSYHNLTTRLRRITGDQSYATVSDGGVPLFQSYRDMAVANGVDPDDLVLTQCRD